MKLGAVYTVGHSTSSMQNFIAVLRQHEITAVADVRSSPYSQYNPQFNREALAADLKSVGMKYVFLGHELGARSDDPKCYENGKVQYHLLADTDLFINGLERVRAGARKYRMVLMCAEKEPLDCHRTILVARKLSEQGLRVKHILQDGCIEDHDATISRLVSMTGLGGNDLFRSREDTILEAYAKRADIIAYTKDVGVDDDRPTDK